MAAMSIENKSVDMFQYVMNDWWDEVGDPLLKDYVPGGPGNYLAIVICYVFFVTSIGPELMRHRKPFELSKVIKIYNILNILINLSIFTAAMIITNGTYELWRCERINVPPRVKAIVGGGYFYLKIFDLLDTLFFVLRKKQSHITGLHVWHHGSMPILCYLGLKFYPYVPVGFIVLLNSFIHILMYTYYYCAADPRLKKYLWWKRYITVAQLVQFSILFVHGLYLIRIGCGLPKWLLSIGLAQGVYFIYGFTKFYIESYKKEAVKDE